MYYGFMFVATPRPERRSDRCHELLFSFNRLSQPLTKLARNTWVTFKVLIRTLFSLTAHKLAKNN